MSDELLVFFGGTLWVTLICIVVNIVMEKVWQRIPPNLPDERGELNLAKHKKQ